MKHQKLIASLFCMTVFFSAAACNSTHLKGGSSSGGGNPSSLIMQESSSTSPVSTGAGSKAVSNTSAGAASHPAASGNLSPQRVSASAGRQDVLKQISAALDTKVPLMLPTDIPLEKDRFLTATTASQAANYKVNLYETKQPAKINSQAASKGTLVASVEGTKYKNTASAKESIPDYVQINPADYDEFADLGHKIKAAEQAGLGHQQLLWNEGRWYIHLDFPTDSAFQTKDYPNSTQLAKNIVAYLDKNALPAPQKIGVISIRNWHASERTIVQWQDSQTVYQISSQNPMTALEVAVTMKS